MPLKILLANPKADAAERAGRSRTRSPTAAQNTGENVHLGKTAVATAPEGGKVGIYIYAITGKIAVLMAFTGTPSR